MDTWERLVDEVMKLVLKKNATNKFHAKVRKVCKRWEILSRYVLHQQWSAHKKTFLPACLKIRKKNTVLNPRQKFCLREFLIYNDKKERESVHQSYLRLYMPQQ